MVKEECSNYSDGNCLGINIHDDLTLSQTNKTKCDIDKQRCVLFEQCLMPLADMQRDTSKSSVFKNAVNIYKRQFGGHEPINRKCPDCGIIIGKRNRYCPKCAKTRKQISNRKRQLKSEDVVNDVNYIVN